MSGVGISASSTPGAVRSTSVARSGERHQQAFRARFAVLGAKVHAGWRVLENKACAPGFARQSPVTALLEKFQFELQYF